MKNIYLLPANKPTGKCKDCSESLEECTCIEDTINMKQETLEEVVEKYLTNEERYAFIDGIKWQQEKDKKMYSEEEVLEQLNHLMTIPSSKLDKFTDNNSNITMKWFEQFKKK